MTNNNTFDGEEEISHYNTVRAFYINGEFDDFLILMPYKSNEKLQSKD